MSGPASDEFSLLRLLRETRPIPASASAKQHPLGLGIRLKQEYKLAGGPARLPKVLAGLENLQKATSQAIPLLQSSLTEPAWGMLLDHPSLIAEIASPSPDRFSAEGILIPASAKLDRLRELVIAVVVSAADLTLARNALSSIPVAGMARLLVETMEHNSAVSTNAWISAKWTASTVELISHLEQCFLDSGPSARKSGRRSTAVALLNSNIVEAVADRLVAAAAICGFNLKIFDESGIYDLAVDEMRSRTPSTLLVQSSLINDAYQVLDIYTGTTAKAPLLLDASSTDGVLASLRARLHEASGVSGGLLLFGDSALSAEDDDGYVYLTQIPLPVKRAGRRAHHPRFGTIEECLEADLWYSRDLADHSRSGTVAFKCFKSGARGIDWTADLDENAKIIASKHKGPVGLHISWGEMAFD